MSLPAADDLFRPTRDASGEKAVRAVPDADDTKTGTGSATSRERVARAAAPKKDVAPRSSGRVRHDEKMTVYITSDELLELEHARLSLRSAHGLAIDRGRIVREAVAMVLADFAEHGEDSALVRRLSEE
ncbi:hypothetical protein [Nocardioides gilvus]|uniref:hypothetical protein n=1 Tax=Nocardioides gilvus TaxID=1735589 RepID=UPI000D74320F